MSASAKAILVGIGILLLSWFAFCLATYEPFTSQHELCDTNYQYYSEQDGRCVDIPDFRAEEMARREEEMRYSQAEQQMDYQEQYDCNIKGNINFNTGEKIYHLPGQEYYDSTEINEAAGERWFCTEEEAIAAGWRKSKLWAENQMYCFPLTTTMIPATILLMTIHNTSNASLVINQPVMQSKKSPRHNKQETVKSCLSS